jgi:hypothetical protein
MPAHNTPSKLGAHPSASPTCDSYRMLTTTNTPPGEIASLYASEAEAYCPRWTDYVAAVLCTRAAGRSVRRAERNLLIVDRMLKMIA